MLNAQTKTSYCQSKSEEFYQAKASRIFENHWKVLPRQCQSVLELNTKRQPANEEILILLYNVQWSDWQNIAW